MKNVTKTQGQAGFSLLGVLIAVMIIGILAAMAVPRLQSAITTANTSRIKADLSTLDSAIGVYEAENGTAPTKLEELNGYIRNASSLKPPKGKCWTTNGETKDITTEVYTIKVNSEGESQAYCGDLDISKLGSSVKKAGE